MTQKKDQIKKKELTQSERFLLMVEKEFSQKVSAGSSIALTEFHKRLCQNYFIHTDIALKKAKTEIRSSIIPKSSGRGNTR